MVRTINPLTKPLGIATAIIALLQSITWIPLTIMAILVYSGSWVPKTTSQTYGGLLTKSLIEHYFNGEPLRNSLNIDLFLGPREVFIWVLIYLCLSVIWLIASLFLFFVISEEKGHLIKKTYLIVGVWYLLICICDLVLEGLFVSDYINIVDAVNNSTEWGQKTFIVLSCGVMMAITAKGYTLWILNLIMAILLIKLSVNIPKTATEEDFRPIEAFGSSSKPHSDSDSFGTFRGLPRLPPIQSTNQRLSNLNKVLTAPTTSMFGAPNRPFLISQQSEVSEGDSVSTTNAPSILTQPTLRNRY